MESNSVCNHTSDKQNRRTAERESDLFMTSMITDWIERHEVLLPINHKNYSFHEKEKESSYEKTGKFGLKYWQRRRKHSKARFRRRTSHEPNRIQWIKFMWSTASESIRNGWHNSDRLSRSSRLGQPGITAVDRLWFRRRSSHELNQIHKLIYGISARISADRILMHFYLL